MNDDVASRNDVASRKDECLRTPCTDTQCVVWDDVLNRCGTPNALKKERQRQEPFTLSKKNKKGAWPTVDKYINEKKLDSIKALEDSSNKTVMAEEYLETVFKQAVLRNEQKHKESLERLREYEKKDGEPLSAVQWFMHENTRLQAEIDNSGLN